MLYCWAQHLLWAQGSGGGGGERGLLEERAQRVNPECRVERGQNSVGLNHKI